MTDAQIKAATAADAVKANEIENDVDKGARDGYGVILLQTQSPAVCMIVGDKMAGHRQVLLDSGDRLTADMKASPTLASTTLDGAFVNIKKSQCGAVYAGAADLKTLAQALKRDALPYHFSTLWFEAGDVAKAEDRLNGQRAVEEQQALERKTRNDEQRRLAALRAADDATTKVSQQDALRKANEATATAAAARIAQEVKDYTDNPTAPLGVLSAKFPEFVAWLRDRIASRWELMTENSALSDYGSSDWKGRRLETTFTQIDFRLRNRMLGDYQNNCFIFGQINDAEFSMSREHFISTCDDSEGISSWKHAHSFVSKWIVD